MVIRFGITPHAAAVGEKSRIILLRVVKDAGFAADTSHIPYRSVLPGKNVMRLVKVERAVVVGDQFRNAIPVHVIQGEPRRIPEALRAGVVFLFPGEVASGNNIIVVGRSPTEVLC